MNIQDTYKINLYARNKYSVDNETFIVTFEAIKEPVVEEKSNIFGLVTLVLFILMTIFICVCLIAIIRICLRKRRLEQNIMN